MITDASGTFGVGIINDSKHGWDKPTDNTLRLTLIHTPRPANNYTYQSSNDLGRHRFTFAIAGHAGDWRQGRLPARAAQLNQPLVAFQSPTRMPGPWVASFSMLSTDDLSGQVAVVALKKAEDSDELIVRLQEQYGQPREDDACGCRPVSSTRARSQRRRRGSRRHFPCRPAGRAGRWAPHAAPDACQWISSPTSRARLR